MNNIVANGSTENILKFGKLLDKEGFHNSGDLNELNVGKCLITYFKEKESLQVNLDYQVTYNIRKDLCTHCGMSNKVNFNLDTQFNEAYKHLFGKDLVKFKIGDKVEIPTVEYTSSNIETNQSSAIRNAKQLNQDFLYVLEINENIITVGTDLRNKLSSFYEKDLELYEEKTNNMNKYKVLKEFNCRKIGDIVDFHDNIPLKWEDKQGFKIETTVNNLIDQGFIVKYEDGYKVGDIVITNCSPKGSKNEDFITKIVKSNVSKIYGDWIYKNTTTDFYNGGAFENIVRKATQEEINQFYISWALSKGYEKGTKVKCLKSNTVETVEVNGYGRNGDEPLFVLDNSIWIETGRTNSLIYRDGKWAEIIKEEEIKIDGYEVIFNTGAIANYDTVNVGCKKGITKDYLEAMIKVQNFCNKYLIDLTIIKDGIWFKGENITSQVLNMIKKLK